MVYNRKRKCDEKRCPQRFEIKRKRNTNVGNITSDKDSNCTYEYIGHIR